MRTQNNTKIVPNETFGTVVGVGGVNGNQSIMSVDFGGVTIDDLAVRKFGTHVWAHTSYHARPAYSVQF